MINDLQDAGCTNRTKELKPQITIRTARLQFVTSVVLGSVG